MAESLGIEIRYESLNDEVTNSAGGLCRIRGKTVLILNNRASVGARLKTVAKALNRFDLGSIYVKPALREFLEKEGE